MDLIHSATQLINESNLGKLVNEKEIHTWSKYFKRGNNDENDTKLMMTIKQIITQHTLTMNKQHDVVCQLFLYRTTCYW